MAVAAKAFIRAVLAEVAPDDLVDFEAEFRCALAEADDNFDLAQLWAARLCTVRDGQLKRFASWTTVDG
jgi:hypothetical protein